MNRRSFISGILTACVAPMFLPGGGRLWKATLEPAINPLWALAEYETVFIFDPILFMRPEEIELFTTGNAPLKNDLRFA